MRRERRHHSVPRAEFTQPARKPFPASNLRRKIRTAHASAALAHPERIRAIFLRKRPRFDPDPRASARKIASFELIPRLWDRRKGSFHPGWPRRGTTAAGLRRGPVGERSGGSQCPGISVRT
jgi:hypothetical protein